MLFDVAVGYALQIGIDAVEQFLIDPGIEAPIYCIMPDQEVVIKAVPCCLNEQKPLPVHSPGRILQNAGDHIHIRDCGFIDLSY